MTRRWSAPPVGCCSPRTGSGYCLTGEIATDLSDGSASFLDIRSGEYSDEALDLYGLSELKSKLPPVLGSTTVAGEVTRDAAKLTGLVAGTPVIVGAHDVDAATIGLDAVETGDASVVAGTFSINQVLVDSIHTDDRWQVRSFVETERWLAMSTSPTSASNLGWFVETLGGEDGVPFSVLEAEVERIDSDPSEISFLPYIYGAPDSAGRASFVGIGSHHQRGHLTRSILQGVVMSYRLHLEWLGSAFMMASEFYLTGGASKSALWIQTFADGLGRRVRPGDSFEPARGGAALASVGVGAFRTIEVAARAMGQLRPIVQPRSERASDFDHIYNRFLSHREMAKLAL